jgi:PKD repeat protein
VPESTGPDPVKEDLRLMAEKETEKEKEKKSGLLKTIVGASGGILSGVLLMYVTGLINTVAKPQKPVPNFKVEVDGLTVRFQNLTPYHNEGWWDFGDGSPLEPVTAEHQVVSHVYPKVGTFTAKMTLHNLLGEEGERAVPVSVSGQVASATPGALPRIATLEAIEVNKYAPATFRVKGQVENAKECVWSLDDGRLRMIKGDALNGVEQLVTFEKPGRHFIKLAVFDSTQGSEPKDQKTQFVDVQPPPKDSLIAILQISGTATQLKTEKQESTLYGTFPSDKKENTAEFSVAQLAKTGCTITEVRVATPDGKGPCLAGDKKETALDPPVLKAGSVRDLWLKLAPDGTAVRLSGKITRSDAKTPAPVAAVPVILTQQSKTEISLAPQVVTGVVAVPASGASAVVLQTPAPGDCVDVHLKMSLELKDGERSLGVMQDLQRPLLVPVRGRNYTVTAKQTNEGILVELR